MKIQHSVIINHFEETGTTIHAGRNVIKLIDTEEGEIVVKRFRKPDFLQKIIYTFFRKTKAFRAYRNGNELIKRGFSTPQPISYIETKKCGFIDYCYYVCGIDNNPPIEDLTDRNDWDRELAADFAVFVAKLHSKGILHHDLNDTNVLYNKDKEGRFSFSLIDINRMRFYPLGKDVPLKECLDNLTRFTGRIDLFQYVVEQYAKERNLDIESTVKVGLKIKTVHDRNWYRRKRFTNKLKKLF